MPELTLYVDSTLTSPYAMSAFVALLEKNLAFSLQFVDLEAGEHRIPPFRDLGLTGRVPALLHGDVVLNESNAIVEYLEEKFPSPGYRRLLPGHPLQRAKAREILAWLRSDLYPLRYERNTDVVFVKPSSRALSPEGQASAQRLIRIAERLILGETLFDEWCIADCDLALMLKRLISNGDAVPQALKDYACEQWKRESIQQWVNLPRVPRVSQTAHSDGDVGASEVWGAAPFSHDQI